MIPIRSARSAATRAIGFLMLGAICAPASAVPVAYSFNWTGDADYSARGVFAYDDATAPAVISETGAGATDSLDFLRVQFFDPLSTPLQSFHTVFDGVSSSQFFDFTFDTSTEQLLGSFNAGGGTGNVGEQFFTRLNSGLARLRQIDTPNPDVVLDAQNPGIITVERLPTYLFSWTGDAGYSVRGAFGFDPSTAPAIISESEAGNTDYLEFLSVSFFDPFGNPLQSFDTVQGGLSESPFFAFNFDTATEHLFSFFNVGGGTGTVGEQFFAQLNNGLTLLRQIDTPNPDIVLDLQNPGTIAVLRYQPATQVPEPSSLALTLSALLALIASRSRTSAPK